MATNNPSNPTAPVDGAVRRRNPGDSPFPFKTPKGKTILDERCRCGHLRSEHGPRFSFGHGACEARAHSNGLGCECSQFTWESHVFARKTSTIVGHAKRKAVR